MKRSAPGAPDSPTSIPLDPTRQKIGRPGLEQSQVELPLGPADGQPVAPGPNAVLEDQRPEASGVASSRRIAGASIDLAVHLGVVAAAVAGSWWMGVSPGRLSLFPLLLLIGCFSFVYHVLPLTFWGYTPGMARVGLVARSTGGGPLTIGQAVRRWLGALLSVASLGLAFALSKERSLSDRLSGSAVQG